MLATRFSPYRMSHGNNRGRRYGRGGAQQSAKDMGKAKKANNGEMVYQVKIPRGAKYGEKFILKALAGHAEAFLPVMTRIEEGGAFTCYIRDEDTAETIKTVNRRIKSPKGELLVIYVNKVPAPWAKLKNEEKEAIAQAVTCRADVPHRALELENFATHEAFTSRDLMMTLSKNNVFLSVMELIEAKYSNIIALSLKNNRLKHLEVAAMLPYFAKQLKVLDLSDNRIESIAELEKLKGLPLTTLFLENNPVCENYSKASDYLSAIQAVFPRVTRLDGNECTPLPSAFDDDKEFVEPPTRPGFYGDDAALWARVELFIIEYFKAYDGPDPTTSRKNLVAAYDDDNSQFSMTLENLYSEADGKSRWPNGNFSDHIRLSHNIKNMDKWGRKESRHCRVFAGALDVAAQLCKMPATRHLPDSFIVDVVLATPSLLIFTVAGLFEEAPFAVAPNPPALNFFSRTFTVTPKENGSIAVISDELYLSAMTTARVDRYRVLLTKALTAAPAAAAAAAAAVPAATTQDIEKAAMLAEMARGSGMTEAYCTACLAEVDWNFEVAVRNFTAAKEQGRIPPEAFINQ